MKPSQGRDQWGPGVPIISPTPLSWPLPGLCSAHGLFLSLVYAKAAAVAEQSCAPAEEPLTETLQCGELYSYPPSQGLTSLPQGVIGLTASVVDGRSLGPQLL